MPPKNTKVCLHCKKEKPIEEFHFRVSIKQHLSSCNPCRSKETLVYYYKNKERVRKRQDKYYRENREEILKRMKKQQATEEGRLVRKKARLKNYQKNRYKWITRGLTSYYIKVGKIIRQPCEVCGEKKSQVHHEDYHNPWKVRWFCDLHHRQHEGRSVITV